VPNLPSGGNSGAGNDNWGLGLVGRGGSSPSQATGCNDKGSSSGLAGDTSGNTDGTAPADGSGGTAPADGSGGTAPADGSGGTAPADGSGGTAPADDSIGQHDTTSEANNKKVPTKGGLNEWKDLEKEYSKRADDSVSPFWNKVKEAWKTATDQLNPKPSGSNKSGPNDDSQINCTDAFNFIKNCQDKNFQSPDCMKLKSECQGHDKAMVNPEGEDPCSMNTEPVVIKNIILPCETTAKPVGPDTDPCNVKITATGYDPCNSADPNSPYAGSAMTDPDAGPQAPNQGCPMTILTLPFSDLGTTTGPCPPDPQTGIIKIGCPLTDPNAGTPPIGPEPGPEDVSNEYPMVPGK
jgi:hypothetical protein